MGRFLIAALLLAVFFLVGALYGMDRSMVSGIDQRDAEVPVLEQPQEEPEVIEEPVIAAPVEMEGPVPLTQKAASLLETVVKGFYEVIVTILYQISQVFV
ncbi:hypothetical protein [Lentibacillus sediminis]|uniref:hypothetical protein n=1 Tax=Lentibacillus sediminis TaxID=1940529 RepID=UPI000C1C4828|nr:hypothetical protein [Lentibacillus sediminis]